MEDGDRPVDAYRVFASPVKPDSRSQGEARKKSVSSSDGRFVHRRPDRRRLRRTGDGAGPGAGDRHRAGGDSGRTTDVGTIRVGRGGVVRGGVVDAAGTAVVGATVRLSGPGQDAHLWALTTTAETEPSGTFEIRGVPEGPKQVVATHPDYAPTDSQVDVTVGRGPTEVRLVMGQGGRIEGSARKRDGTPLVGLRVSAWSMGGGHLNWGGQPQATTGADGRFAIDHVRPGRTNVNLMSSGSPGRPISMTMLSKTTEVREGETTTVDFLSREILVTGRVTRSGTPLPGLRVRLMGESMSYMSTGIGGGITAAPTGPQRLQGVTDEDGSFELIVDDPGQYRALIESQDARRRYPMRTLKIPDVETHGVELALSGVPVSGVVVDQDTEKPLEQAGITLSPKAPRGATAPRAFNSPGGATTGPDGRFELDADPGDYRLHARAEGYRNSISDVTVGEAGSSDLRVELEHGLEIRGRVLDPGGRPLSGITVSARSDEIGLDIERLRADSSGWELRSGRSRAQALQPLCGGGAGGLRRSRRRPTG